MVVKSNFRQKKNIFVIVFLEIRFSLLKNLILALGIKRVTHNSPIFFCHIQKKKQQKLLITTFLLVLENFKDIANRSDSIGIATAYFGIPHNLAWFNFFKQKSRRFFSELHSLKSDANCSRSTKHVSKLGKDFLGEPLEKNSDSELRSRSLTTTSWLY